MSDLIKSLKYTFYIFAHPSDGFWFMKSQKIANVKSGLVMLLLLIVTSVIRIYTTGYLISTVSLSDFSVWLLVLIIIGVVLLYCISNWALTTLIDGKGSFSEIFISLMYSLTPLTIINLPVAILSNIVVLDEAVFLTFINVVTVAFCIILILFANYSIHDFSAGKSLFAFLGTLFAMIVIVVIGILFFNLFQQVFVWITSIIQEATYRL